MSIQDTRYVNKNKNKKKELGDTTFVPPPPPPPSTIHRSHLPVFPIAPVGIQTLTTPMMATSRASVTVVVRPPGGHAWCAAPNPQRKRTLSDVSDSGASIPSVSSMAVCPDNCSDDEDYDVLPPVRPRRRRRTGAPGSSPKFGYEDRQVPGVNVCLLHATHGKRACNKGLRNRMRPSLIQQCTRDPKDLAMCHNDFMFILRHFGQDKQPHLRCYRHHDGHIVEMPACRHKLDVLRSLGVHLKPVETPCRCEECMAAGGPGSIAEARGVMMGNQGEARVDTGLATLVDPLEAAVVCNDSDFDDLGSTPLAFTATPPGGSISQHRQFQAYTRPADRLLEDAGVMDTPNGSLFTLTPLLSSGLPLAPSNGCNVPLGSGNSNDNNNNDNSSSSSIVMPDDPDFLSVLALIKTPNLPTPLGGNAGGSAAATSRRDVTAHGGRLLQSPCDDLDLDIDMAVMDHDDLLSIA